jgi:hypothetical protein
VCAHPHPLPGVRDVHRGSGFFFFSTRRAASTRKLHNPEYNDFGSAPYTKLHAARRALGRARARHEKRWKNKTKENGYTPETDSGGPPKKRARGFGAGEREKRVLGTKNAVDDLFFFRRPVIPYGNNNVGRKSKKKKKKKCTESQFLLRLRVNYLRAHKGYTKRTNKRDNIWSADTTE